MRKYFAVALALASLAGCTKSPNKKTLWIYTSIYPHVIQILTPQLAQKFPAVEVKWYQAGSENVAAKVNAELLAGKPQADLILTSDPFWYEDLKARGALLPYNSPAANSVKPELRDPEHHFVTVRIPVMVIGYNSTAIPETEAPRSFKDLAEPAFKDKVAMGSPLESGTSFTAAAMLSRKYGWEYFSALRKNNVIATGGNSAVIGRMETRERPIGVVLLENILTAARKTPHIKTIYPSDGVILVPSPIAIMKASDEPELAKQVYDFFFSNDAQQAILKGDMYSPLRDFPAPEGARPLSEILPGAFPWDATVLKDIFGARDAIKKDFARAMLD